MISAEVDAGTDDVLDASDLDVKKVKKKKKPRRPKSTMNSESFRVYLSSV
jgi:hypothetical protein